MQHKVLNAPSLPFNLKNDQDQESSFNSKGFYDNLIEKIDINEV